MTKGQRIPEGQPNEPRPLEDTLMELMPGCAYTIFASSIPEPHSLSNGLRGVLVGFSFTEPPIKRPERSFNGELRFRIKNDLVTVVVDQGTVVKRWRTPRERKYLDAPAFGSPIDGRGRVVAFYEEGGEACTSNMSTRAFKENWGYLLQ
jgi:hypothetical protein